MVHCGTEGGTAPVGLGPGPPQVEGAATVWGLAPPRTEIVGFSIAARSTTAR